MKVQRPKYRHFKGGTYVVLNHATLESDLTDVIVYQSLIDGRIWVRPKEEFFGWVTEDGVQKKRFHNQGFAEVEVSKF